MHSFIFHYKFEFLCRSVLLVIVTKLSLGKEVILRNHSSSFKCVYFFFVKFFNHIWFNSTVIMFKISCHWRGLGVPEMIELMIIGCPLHESRIRATIEGLFWMICQGRSPLQDLWRSTLQDKMHALFLLSWFLLVLCDRERLGPMPLSLTKLPPANPISAY